MYYNSTDVHLTNQLTKPNKFTKLNIYEPYSNQFKTQQKTAQYVVLLCERWKVEQKHIADCRQLANQ